MNILSLKPRAKSFSIPWLMDLMLTQWLVAQSGLSIPLFSCFYTLSISTLLASLFAFSQLHQPNSFLAFLINALSYIFFFVHEYTLQFPREQNKNLRFLAIKENVLLFMLGGTLSTMVITFTWQFRTVQYFVVDINVLF